MVNSWEKWLWLTSLDCKSMLGNFSKKKTVLICQNANHFPAINLLGSYFFDYLPFLTYFLCISTMICILQVFSQNVTLITFFTILSRFIQFGFSQVLDIWACSCCVKVFFFNFGSFSLVILFQLLVSYCFCVFLKYFHFDNFWQTNGHFYLDFRPINLFESPTVLHLRSKVRSCSIFDWHVLIASQSKMLLFSKLVPFPQIEP